MTGKELFEQEMRKRGFNTSQINSKAVAFCLDFFANNGDDIGKWYKISELNEEIQQLERRIESKKRAIDGAERNLIIMRNELEAQVQKAKEDGKYLEELLKKIENSGDQETKNTIALMQTFYQAVEINTKYDNTAFIAGCAAILSKGKIDALTEFKKVNPKVTSMTDVSIAKGSSLGFNVIL